MLKLLGYMLLKLRVVLKVPWKQVFDDAETYFTVHTI